MIRQRRRRLRMTTLLDRATPCLTHRRITTWKQRAHAENSRVRPTWTVPSFYCLVQEAGFRHHNWHGKLLVCRDALVRCGLAQRSFIGRYPRNKAPWCQRPASRAFSTVNPKIALNLLRCQKDAANNGEASIPNLTNDRLQPLAQFQARLKNSFILFGLHENCPICMKCIRFT